MKTKRDAVLRSHTLTFDNELEKQTVGQRRQQTGDTGYAAGF